MKIPTMTGAATHAALEAIGRAWTGRGVAVECGCWLGASTCALLRGLVAAGYDRPIYAFDRWVANASEVDKAGDAGMMVTLGENLLPIWHANVSRQYQNICPQRGELRRLDWSGRPIEILVVDAAKREPVFSHLMGQFGPHLVDGAWVALLDYFYWRKFDGAAADALRCQERWVSGQDGHWKMVTDLTGESGAIFRYLQGRANG